MVLCVVILLQLARMSDDSETVEDTEKAPLAEVTDDSCTVEFIEIVPLDRESDDFHAPEFVDPLVIISLGDLQEVNHESSDENDIDDPNYSAKQEPADDCETESPCFTISVQ